MSTKSKRKRPRVRERPADDSQPAIDAMFDAYMRLRDLGWRQAIYCPKDGSEFEVIEIGSTGIHNCHYSGEWPKGSWWVASEGDLYPSHPVMFRLKPEASHD